jgi:two-component system sensor histidine kinase YesM
LKHKGLFRQLSTQLIIFYMIICLIVLSAVSYFIYSFMMGMIKDNNEKLLLQQFQQLDHNINGLIEDVDSLAKFFALDASVQRFFNYTPGLGDVELFALKNEMHAAIETYVSNYDFIDSIYIIGDEQGAIGGTHNTTLVHPNQDWLNQFVASAFFREIQQAFPKMIVRGGMDKSYYNPYMVNDYSGSVVSMARVIRSIYESSKTAILVLNVDEHYLSSIYSTSLEAADGVMYIVDEKGVVISSSNEADIGSVSSYFPFIENSSGYGSYDGRASGDSVQVVYYRLNQANWHMIKEIPLSQLSEQLYGVQMLLVAVFLLSLVVIFVISYFWLKKMTRPLQILAHKMRDMSRGELGATFSKIPNNEFGLVIRRFNEMSLSIVELINKTNEMQEKRRELEMEALQNQINPHFLYNTLNMIRWMATIIKADNIVNSIVALGNILRPVFASKDTMCTLRDELYYLENYIKIINLRFSNSVIFTIDVDDQSLEHKVPRFILQPLIENSITFGRQEDGRAIHIRIQAYEDNGDFMIDIFDSGVGIASEKLNKLNEWLTAGVEHSAQKDGGNGIGLYNVNKRIQLNYTKDFGVRLIPQTAGTLVQVRLPGSLDD